MHNNPGLPNRSATAVDIFCVTFVLFLILLALLFPSRIPDAKAIVSRLAVALLVHGGTLWLLCRRPASRTRVTIRIMALAILFGFLFDQMRYFQQLIHDSWLDSPLLRLERAIFGGDINLFLERFVHPYLTETMMFAYVAYLPLLPLFAYLTFRAGGSPALNDYLLNLCLIFIFCFLGYMIVPIASPMYFSPGQFTVPLEGGVFTWCGEWLRHNQHYPGGSLPSAHCAAATGMLAMLHRYNRNIFYVALPTILILFISTVYGRYHYMTDGITGILCAMLVMRMSPRLVKFLDAVLSWGHMSRSRGKISALGQIAQSDIP